MRTQVERSFDRQFDGKLEIGSLRGDLVYRLFAENIRIYDSDDNVVAVVDHLVMRPSWTDIIKRRIRFSSFSADGVDVYATADSTGSWNIARIFSNSSTDTTKSTEFSVADLDITDLSIETVSNYVSSPVESGTLFDYGNSRYLFAEAHVALDLKPSSRIIDVYSLQGTMPGTGVRIDDVQGQAVVEPHQVSINNLYIESGDMTGSIAGFVQSADGTTPLALSTSILALDVILGDVDNQVIASILPTWKYEGEFDFRAGLSGPLSSLNLSSASLTSGDSEILFDGTVVGLPDSVVVSGDIGVPMLLARDVDTVAPHLDISNRVLVDSLRLNSRIDGIIVPGPLPSLNVSFDNLEMQSTIGGVSGSMTYALSDQRVSSSSGALTIRQINPGPLLIDERFDGNLNGHLEFRSENLSKDGLRLEAVADLYHSSLGPVAIDTTTINGFVDNDLFSGDVRIAHGRGSLVAGVSLDLAPTTPRYELELVSRRLDLASIYRGFDAQTEANGRISLYGSGLNLDDIHGRMIVSSDSSSVTSPVGDVRYLQTDGTAVSLERQNTSTIFNVSGDIVSGTIEADAAPSTLNHLRQHWKDVLTRRTSQLVPSRTDSTAADTTHRAVVPWLADLNVQTDATIRANISFEDEHLLHALMPQAQLDANRLDLSLNVEASLETLTGTSRISADTLAAHPFLADSLEASLDITARVNTDSTDIVNFAATATSRHGSLLRQRLATPELAVVMNDRVGSFTFKSTNDDGVSPVDISARIANDNRGTRFVFDRMSVESSTYSLALNGEKSVRVYRDAVVVDQLELDRQDAGKTAEEHIRIDGALSALPGDTMSFVSTNLSLDDLSRVFSFRKPIGGRLDSDLRLSISEKTPVALGNLQIRNVAIDERVLGDLTARSTFASRGGQIEISAALKPTAEVPPSDMILTRNDIDLRGSFLPDSASGRRRIDLRAEIHRADLFFFEYIFSSTIDDVRGLATGSGRITGTFEHPVFNADLAVEGGDFTVPRFNLHYGIEGDVDVDDTGIHVRQAALQDFTGGSATIDGSVLFNNYDFFSLDLSGSLAGFEIMNVANSDELPFFGHIEASGNATLTGPIYGAQLQSANAVTTAESELYIPLVEAATVSDASFIVFTDSTGMVPDLAQRNRRRNVLARRPPGERSFIDGLDMDLNILAPEGSTVHLVIDPLVGDVINAVGNARVQIQRRGGEFLTYGSFIVTGGDYLFTAGEVFVRKFDIDQGGVIIWDGDPTNAQLNIPASYRTRASRAGLPIANETGNQTLIPLVVRLNITGRVATPEVTLSLEIDRSDRNISTSYESIETILNQPERATEYATSVLLTNSFLLTTQGTNSEALTTSAFNSLSQLVASQLNRYINQALPNIDFSFGIQGDSAQELDVTYGIALRLLDERLVIRGQGVYQGARSSTVSDATQQSLQGEFVVEVRLNPSVSVEVFYRREGDVLTEESFLTNTTGAGLSYQTEFASWRRFFRKLFGRDIPEQTPPPSDDITAERQ